MAQQSSAVATEQSLEPRQNGSVTSAVIPLNETGPQVWIMVAVLFVGALLLRLLCYTGLIGSDDLLYSQYAQEIANGTYKLAPIHNALRYGLLLPLAASYRLFGVQDWTTVLPSLIFSSLAAPLLGLIAARVSGIRQAWIAGWLMATFPVAVRYGSIMVPEPVLETMLLVAALLFLLAQASDSVVLAVLTGTFLGLSYLTKEPAAFVAMAFVLYLVVARRWKLAFLMCCGVGLVLAAEFAWYWVGSGDLLYRVHAMATNDSSPEVVEINQHLTFRLWKAYPEIMLIPSIDYGLHSLLALGMSLVAVVYAALGGLHQKLSETQAVSRRSAAMLWLLLWAILPLLYLNFGTSSFRHFWALPVAPRYLGLVYQPLFVLAAMALVTWANAITAKRAIAMSGILAVCLVGAVCAFRTRDTGYRTADIRVLKQIVTEERQNKGQICQVDEKGLFEWRQILQIIGPDVLGCSGPSLVNLAPDAHGLPAIASR